MSRKTAAKARFTAQDDAILAQAVERQGISDWSSIAGSIPGRTPRQCRERWNNYVNPELVYTAWTASEDETLLEKYAEFGRKWYIIKRYLKGRSRNSVQKRYFVLQRKEAQRPSSKPAVTEEPHSVVESRQKARDELEIFETESSDLITVLL
jgi:hypothetical protein